MNFNTFLVENKKKIVCIITANYKPCYKISIQNIITILKYLQGIFIHFFFWPYW